MSTDPQPNAPGEHPASEPNLSVVASLAQSDVQPSPLWNKARTDAPGVGSMVGSYQLRRVLAQGRINRIYLAEHAKFGVPVTVKLLDLTGFPDEARLRSALQSEGAILARLNHPQVIRVWDVEPNAAFPYLVAEYHEGCTLDRLIQRNGVLHPNLAVGLLRQVVEALAHAFSHRVVHRDVKPANILVGNDGTVKMADFGSAIVLGVGVVPLPADENAESAVTGTAAFLAPEQACHPQGVDHRADMYALGATLYQAVTGRLPFEGRSVLDVIRRHLKDDPLPPIAVRPEVPVSVSDLILRLLAKDPSDRFDNYDQLRIAMGRAIGDRWIPRSLAESIMRFSPDPLGSSHHG